MVLDPGTIYSDDEVELETDDSDDETEIKETKSKGSLLNPNYFYDDFNKKDDDTSKKNESHFYDELDSDNFSRKFENAEKTKLKSQLEKFIGRKASYNVDSAIQKVKSNLKIDADIDIGIDKFVTEEKEDNNPSDLKLKKEDIKRKESKRKRNDAEKKRKDKKEEEESDLIFEKAPEVPADSTFLQMNLFPPILKAIANMNYRDPTPIQTATIPIALKGRDICGCAATGTGKTAAFMIPIIQRLLIRPAKDAITRVLVLVPTRELGVQVYENSEQIAAYSDLTLALAVGGLDLSTQTEELSKNPDIIIATPGRLIDHIHNTPHFTLKEIEILVLDEADRMLDEFFVEQMNEIVRQCCRNRQTMLFSATMTDKVKDLAAVSLKNPIKVFVNNNTDVAQNLRQEFVRLKEDTEKYRISVLSYLITHLFKDHCMVFVPTKIDCHRLHVAFGLLGVKCGELHSNLKQHQRLKSLEEFKDRKLNILFATDVAARGLDIKGVMTVINYTVPRTYEMYVHRVGRTARAGFTGRSITLSYRTGSDYSMLKKIQKNSLYPLYERFIKKNIIELFMKKTEHIEKAVEDVLEVEKEEKQMHGVMLQMEEARNRLTGDFKEKPKRKRVKNIFKSKKEIIIEKERLKAIVEGKRVMPEKRQKKKKPEDKISEIEKARVRSATQVDKTVQKNAKWNNKQQNNANTSKAIIDFKTDIDPTSNFAKDLTKVTRKTTKRHRAGPSYQERKANDIPTTKKRKK